MNAILPTLVLAALVAAAGCLEPPLHPDYGMGDHHDAGGHPHGHGGASADGEANRPFTGQEDVIIHVLAGDPDEFRFVPDRIEVEAGQTVGIVFENRGRAPHEFDIATLGFHLHAEPGATVEAAFVAPGAGDHEFACFVPGHYGAGMLGTLVVAPAPADSGP